MATGILGISTSALLANQQALATVSHNIANASVEGYSRQSVEFRARMPALRGGNYFGNGVDLVNVRRHVDLFINEEIYSGISERGQLETEQTYLVRVDNLLANQNIGLSAAFDQFFGSLQDMSLDPTSIPQRELVLQDADTLAKRFNDLNGLVSEMDQEINLKVDDQVSRINSLAVSLATLNESLSVATASSNGQAASDLLDQRDRLYGELSELVPISTIQQSDGSTNVFIGNGQALVVGTVAFSLATQANSLDGSRLDITYQGASNVNITGQINGGSLGGLLNTRRLAIDPTLNQLGRLAVALEQGMNSQQQLGMDLDGLLGPGLFVVGQPLVTAAPSNVGVSSLAVVITDPAGLTGADYRVDIDVSNNYILTNLDNGTITSLGAVPPGPGTVPVTVDGLTVDLAPGAVAGDFFLLQPTKGLAGSLNLAITDPRKLAAASPLLATTGGNNSGSAAITGLQMVDATNAAFTTTAGTLSPPVLVQFTGPGSFDLFDNSNPLAPVLLEAGIAYTPGAELFPTPGALDFGYRLQLVGSAVAGDSLQVDYNTGGIGDNQNLLAMIDQQNQGFLSAGSATYQESYQQLVGTVGTRTSSGAINLDAVEGVLEQTELRRQSVAGVNLDEEAAKLLEFQQAYQAVAKTIQAADTLFQSLLQVI